MRGSFTVGGAVLVAGCIAAFSAGGQTQASAQEFIERLVAAINSKDVERRKALLHAGSLRCRTAGQTAAIVEGFERQANHPIPEGYRWDLRPIPPDQPMLFSERYEYAVLPTHLLKIDFTSGPHNTTALILQVAYTGSEWSEVAACPRPGTPNTAH
jgi:hypothetical protein